MNNPYKLCTVMALFIYSIGCKRIVTFVTFCIIMIFEKECKRQCAIVTEREKL